MNDIDWEKGTITPPAVDWDSGEITPPAKQNTGAGGDLATSLKRGVEKLPGIVTGVLDVPPALVFGTRPFEKIATAAGEATGFELGKWAEEAQAEYSPEYRQTAESIQATWDDPNATWGQKLGQYAKHPSYTAAQITEAAPSMVAGGAAGRMLMLAGRGAGAGAGTLERAVGEKLAAPIAGGVGEGVVQTGAAMEQSKDLEDQRKAAIAALGSGAIDAVIGAGAGRIAGAAGLETVETAMAKGFNSAVEKELSLGRRVAGGAISEGLLQELPQSAQEQVWQNYAEGKPLWENVPRSAVEGALAGFVMGGAVNIRGGKAQPTPDTTGAPAAPDTSLTMAAPDTSLTMAAPGTPLTTPAPPPPPGSIPYERVAPEWMELAAPDEPLSGAAPRVRGPQVPGNWELAPPGASMSAPYKALGLPHYKFDTNIVFPDGSIGTQHQVDQYLAALPEAKRIPELARMLKGAYVAPPTPAVPHPNAPAGSLSAAVNVATTSGAIPATPKEPQNVIRQPSPAGQIPPVGEGRQDLAGGGGGVRQGEQGREATQTRQAATEAGGVPAAEVAQGKLQLKTPEGAWQYVTASPEGFRHTIYPTNAVGADRLAEAQAAHPGVEFRVAPVRGTPAAKIEPTQNLTRDSSWVIKNKETGEIVMETFDKKKVDALNTAKYEAVPILKHLQSLNAPATPAPKPDTTLRPHVATLVSRKSIVDQTVPGLIEKAKQALASGKGKASDFTKAATMFPVKEAPIRTALLEIAAQLKTKPTVKATVAKAQQNLSVGKTALSAEPITVRKGIVHIGEYPAVDYDTGDDITVSEGATPHDIRAALVHGGAVAKGMRIFGAGKAEKVMYSKVPSAASRIAGFWKSVASDPKAFKYGEVDKSVSSAEDIAKQVSTEDLTIEGRDVDNGALFTSKQGRLHVVPHGTARNVEGGYAEYVIQAPGAKSAGMPEGGGSAMYQAAQLWVYANGGKFVGDDHLSEINKLRVTSNQLSNALRTGTTDHIAPDKDQGVKGWTDGNTNNNIAALALREMELVYERIPALRTLFYDFDRNRIVDSKNAVIMADEIRRLLSRSDPQFAKGVGFTTAIRALATRAALREEGGRGREGTARLPRDNESIGAEPVLYERGDRQRLLNPHSTKSFRKSLVDAHSGAAKRAIQHMLDTHQARVITSGQAANLLGEDVIYDGGDLTRGFFSPSNNTTYFIADHFDRNATPTELRGIVRHEVGVHAYQMNRSNAEFKDILRQLDMMRRAGNAAVKEAYTRVPAKTNAEDIDEEALAYLVQHSPELGIVRRVVAWFRNALRAMGLGSWVGELRTDDIMEMVQTAMLRGAVVEREGGFAPKFGVAGSTDTPAFKKWFGDSKVVDTKGAPLVVYHGTNQAITAFDPTSIGRRDAGFFGSGFYFTADESQAQEYADTAVEDTGEGQPIAMPLYLSLQNPFVWDMSDEGADVTRTALASFGVKREDVRGNSAALGNAKERGVFNRAVRAAGFDGVIVRDEDGVLEIIAFEPTQIKSAIGNIGTFRQDTPNILLSVHSYGDLTEAQSATVARVFGKPPTVMERAKEFRKTWRKSLEQGIFDQFAPIREISTEGYMKARMSKGGDSTLEAVFMYGKPVLDENGDIKVEFDAKNKGLNGFANVLSKLDGEHDRFLAWVAALRAGSLKEIGLENLWTEGDIATLKTLNKGRLANGESREAAYNTALKEMMAYNNAVLKIAEQRGLISEETRKMYEATPYIPFYRLADEGAVQGFTAQAGLVNQHAWKKLSGGKNKLNEDLLANMLQNWSHLITASARNDAARATLEEAVRLGVAEEIPAGSPTKGAVVYRENSATKMERGAKREDGTYEYKRVPADGPVRNHERSFIVDDPHLLDAITSLGAVVRVPKPLRLFKHYLTMGVTINPAFKIRNLMRDSIQAMALSELSLNPAKNIAEGAKLTAKSSEIRAQMLASGAIIRFGSMLDGQTADMGRELVEKMGVPKDHILDDANKVSKFWKHTVKPAFDAYQELGDRGEQINRAALYKQLMSKGMTHGEAAYWARDLMDFSMSGKWTAIRFLTQTVPFMNARLQGLYKLGRSAKADKQRFAIVTGGVIMASLMLLAAYHDDDDWKKREDWDRDNYWWFKVGGKAIYIPKPFEIGAIGTIAERIAELMGDDEMTGKRFNDLLFNLVNHQLSMNPTPQAIKPLIDLWANKDSFTGKPIETMGMEKLRPEDRYKQSTSGVARMLSELGLPNPTQLAMGHYEQMSPVQIDHLVRGYFSWVGTTATTALDYGVFRPMEKTERPAMQLQDVFLAGNFVKDLPAGSSRYVTQMYDQAKEIEQAYASYRAALRMGETERAAELMKSEGGKIRQQHMVATIKRLESELSARARMIERSDLSAEEKRAQLTRIQAQRDVLARKIKP